MTWMHDCHQKGHEQDVRFGIMPYAKSEGKGFFLVPCKKCSCLFLVEADIPTIINPNDVTMVKPS